MHYSSGLCTPSDPNLMNARWQHLIILDPRDAPPLTLYYSSYVAICNPPCSSPWYLATTKGQPGPS